MSITREEKISGGSQPRHISKPGQLDYVVACGPADSSGISHRFAYLSEALQAAFDDSTSYRLPASVHFDGALYATVVAS